MQSSFVHPFRGEIISTTPFFIVSTGFCRTNDDRNVPNRIFPRNIVASAVVTVVVMVFFVVMCSKFELLLAPKSIMSGDAQAQEESYSTLTSHRQERV